MTFEELTQYKERNLYAGTIYARETHYNKYVGLSLDKNDSQHIPFDITKNFPLENNSIDSFVAEDVLEHIDYTKLPLIINEIFRILKPNATFRISVPDYNCDILYKRSLYNYAGEIIFDPLGGGTFENPGHIWFPTFSNVDDMLKKTDFFKEGTINFLHYYKNKENFVCKDIDYSKGYIERTPDHDPRVQNPYRPMSIVVDLTKKI